MSKAATGKKKGIVKGKKKGSKKKIVDPFLKKEWYVVKVPQYLIKKKADELAQQNSERVFTYIDSRIGFSPAKKGGARRQLAGRSFEMNLQDLYNQPFSKDHKVANKYGRDEKHSWKNFKFTTEEVYGRQILTQWNGMAVTRNHRASLIRKWHTMIQCFVDAKTKDGYLLRVKALAFTKRQPEQIKKNCYAKNSQVRQIRNRMRDAIRNAITQDELPVVTKKLAESTIGIDIKKSCQLIFPLKECLIEKVKVLKKPRREVDKLMKMHDLKTTYDPLIKSDDEGDAQDGDGSASGGSGDDDDSGSSEDSI